jgi:sec-independent protein translocase protein TatA
MKGRVKFVPVFFIKEYRIKLSLLKTDKCMPTILFISGQEIFFVLIIVLILFGSKKIPEVAKGLGKGLSEFRKATDDIKRELNEETDKIKKDFKDMDRNIKS